MNAEVLDLLNHPLSVSSNHLFLLEDEIEHYPYFQPLHLLRAKAVSQSKDEKFSSVLNTTATYCANRVILFEYLNKENPKTDSQAKPNNETTLSSTNELREENSIENEALMSQIEKSSSTSSENDEKLPATETNKNDVEDIIETNEKVLSAENDSEKLDKEDTTSESEKPIPSEPATTPMHDRHSFGEWLSLTSQNQSEKTEVVNEKFKIIEDFLEKNPKISPAKVYKPTVEINPNPRENLSHLMTETLANIYVEQNKYDKAIKAYTILRLKYPEKSGYFADRIKEIKDLKNN